MKNESRNLIVKNEIANEEIKNLIYTINEANSKDEIQNNFLRSQFATLDENIGRGKHRKYLPYVFTK